MASCFFFHVGDFAHGDVLLALGGIVDRVKVAAENVLGLIIVAEPELQTQDGAQWNKVVEHRVIADGPGTQQRKMIATAAAFVNKARICERAVRQPSAKKREQRSERRVEHQR